MEGDGCYSTGLLSVFFIFKTYQGIIRFSELHEAVTAISAVFCSFAAAAGEYFLIAGERNAVHSPIQSYLCIFYLPLLLFAGTVYWLKLCTTAGMKKQRR